MFSHPRIKVDKLAVVAWRQSSKWIDWHSFTRVFCFCCLVLFFSSHEGIWEFFNFTFPNTKTSNSSAINQTLNRFNSAIQKWINKIYTEPTRCFECEHHNIPACSALSNSVVEDIWHHRTRNCNELLLSHCGHVGELPSPLLCFVQHVVLWQTRIVILGRFCPERPQRCNTSAWELHGRVF